MHMLPPTNESLPSPPPRVELTSSSEARPPQCTGRTCRGSHRSDSAVTFVSATETKCHPATKLGTGHETSCRREDSSLDDPRSICAQPKDLAASLQTMHCVRSLTARRGAMEKTGGIDTRDQALLVPLVPYEQNFRQV